MLLSIQHMLLLFYERVLNTRLFVVINNRKQAVCRLSALYRPMPMRFTLEYFFDSVTVDAFIVNTAFMVAVPFITAFAKVSCVMSQSQYHVFEL